MLEREATTRLLCGRLELSPGRLETPLGTAQARRRGASGVYVDTT